MLALFKGELRMHEFMREIPYKAMLALRDARIQQLVAERKANEEAQEKQKREMARNQILRH